MPYNVTATYLQEARKTDSITPLNMYVLNASYSGTEYLYYCNYNQDVYGYTVDSNGDLTAVEQLYTAIPIKQGNITTNSSGEDMTVGISVPNTDRVIESYIQSANYLRGNRVYILNCFAKHLPTGSTAHHIGTTPNRFAVIKEMLLVDSVSSNEEVVTFNCKPKMSVKGVQLPRRKYTRECWWAMDGDYAGSICNPAGTLNTASYPTCGGTIASCLERHNTNRFGGFPSIPRKGFQVV